MNHDDETRLRESLREAFRPPPAGELTRDLWPAMLRQLEERQTRRSWIDWALAGLAMSWILVFPQAIPALLFHL